MCDAAMLRGIYEYSGVIKELGYIAGCGVLTVKGSV